MDRNKDSSGIFNAFRVSCVLLMAIIAGGMVSVQKSGGMRDSTNPGNAGNVDTDLAPLPLKLPAWRLEGTPQNMADVHLDPNDTGMPRPPFMAPRGITNVALHKKVTSSDKNPIIGSLDLVTDGDKEADDGSYVELAEGKQWVQIDLGAEYKIYAILCWHRHDDGRVYYDVVIQTSNDPDFKTGVTTLFNNDQANDLGFGAGKDYEYAESAEGKLIDAKKTKARYVRLYSAGSTADAQNHYTEVEVYALPVAQ